MAQSHEEAKRKGGPPKEERMGVRSSKQTRYTMPLDHFFQWNVVGFVSYGGDLEVLRRETLQAR